MQFVIVQDISEPVDRPIHSRRVVLVAVTGHAIEWYEFAIYGVVAVYIAGAVFPSDDPQLSLMLTWLAYSVAFFIRPLGGIVLAHVGDRYGRPRALFATVFLMSGATAGMALVPGFEAAGIAAPIAFVSLRLLQGFAIGGEMSSAVTYVFEHSSPARRSRTASFLAAGTFSASVFGSVLAATLANNLSDEAMVSWGWRLLFIGVVPLAIVAMLLRRRAPESLGFEKRRRAGEGEQELPFAETMRTQKSAMLRYVGLGLLYNVALASLLGGYTNELLLRGMSRSETLIVTTGTYATLVIGILVFGSLGDRFGIRVPLKIGLVGIVALTVPMTMLGFTAQLPLALLGSATFALAVGVFATPIYRSLAEMFPSRVRVTAGSIAFNTATAFASLVPAATLWLRTAFEFEYGLIMFLGIAATLATVTLAVRAEAPVAEYA
jgi:MHS family proline/betaine transporter-like MFS transporter